MGQHPSKPLVRCVPRGIHDPGEQNLVPGSQDLDQGGP